ncbi:hypothetical protein [Rhodococcus pyridinivorans]|uniref:hypothetical protein n=1 Tax=Rhodococcus pyridinivorans TaxID=103816 RepID=UPI0039B559AF
MAYKAGAHYVADDFSNSLTLLVYGALPANTVADTERVYSDKLVALQRARSQRQPHIHVVDADGFADLLEDKPARCQRLRASKGTIVIPPLSGGGIFGGPLVHRRPTVRRAKALTIDLGALDAGTAAHENVVRLLGEYLEDKGIDPQRPARRGPAFDIGWQRGNIYFVGEVKSLGGASEDQQIRLGLGQVLDYAHQLSDRHKVQPVLILERQPLGARWETLARSLKVLLTYGPDFPGV